MGRLVYVSRCRFGYNRSIRHKPHAKVPNALKSDMLSVFLVWLMATILVAFWTDDLPFEGSI